MPSCVFKLNESSINHFKSTGEWDTVRGIDHYRTHGLWMFWVYFIYLALFGLIILIWPSYPGLALTDWIAREIPYGVLSLTNDQLLDAHAVFPRSILIHIVIWQILTCTWLWVVSLYHAALILRLIETNLLFVSDITTKGKKAKKLIAAVLLFLFCMIFLLLFLIYPFVTWPLMEFVGLRDFSARALDWKALFMWLCAPLLLWQVPFIMSLYSIANTRHIVGWSAKPLP